MSQGIHPAPFYSSSRFFFRILQLSAHPITQGNMPQSQKNAAGYLCLSTVYRVSQCQRSLIYNKDRKEESPKGKQGRKKKAQRHRRPPHSTRGQPLQKGGVPAAPSGTATLLRLSPNHRFHPRPTLAVTDFRRPRLSWLDGRCVQGPGTYSPRHG